MGSASCKNPKSSKQDQEKENNKKITIGVFGLDNAGKTSAVKAIEGVPTDNALPTIGSKMTQVAYPTSGKNNKKSQERITLIDVSGSKSYRQRSWSNFYQQIHGLIFVLDSSEKKRLTENKDTLDDLLEHPDLKDKPILILANKQDCRHAITRENDIKEKLDIENLRRKHKIELCQATPVENNKTDDSIRTGFSWLIRTIEENYSTINAHVTNGKTVGPSKPIDKKSPIINRNKGKSDQSDNDDDIVYTGKRKSSPPPPFQRKPLDTRSAANSFRLPDLDLNRTKPKISGHETFDESDDDNARARSRPNISRTNDEPPFRQPTNSTLNPGFNKKKKLTGSSNKDTTEQTSRKSTDTEPKSFRATYESFPDETPWSSTLKKSTKADELPYRFNTKSLLTTDTTNKRAISPLVHDTKFQTNSLLSKRDSGSDDENKTNRSLNSKSTFKKPSSGVYGADDDDDDDKTKNNFNRTSQRLSDRSNFNNDYRGLTGNLRSKLDDDNRSRFNKDTSLPSYAKPPAATLSRFNNNNDDDKDRYLSSLRSRLSGNDSIDRPLSASKINALSKYSDESSKLTPKLSARSKHDDDDDLPSSTSKFAARSNYSSLSKPISTQKKSDDDDDDLPSLTKPTNRIGMRSVTRSPPSSPPLTNSKFNTRSKLQDDDYDLPSSKPAARSNYRGSLRSPPSPPSPVKTSARRKDDNDDDDDKYGSSSKLASRTNFKSNTRPSSPPKTNSRWKNNDDDDDLSSKPSTRFNPKSNSRSTPSPPLTKPKSRSTFEDDDDDQRSKPTTSYSSYTNNRRSSPPSPPAKSNARSKYQDDDDDDLPSSKTPARSNYKSSYRSSPSPPPSKPSNPSKFEDDDDDDNPRSKATTHSPYTNNRRSSPSPPPKKTTNRWEDDDDDDKNKYKSSSSASRTNTKFNSRSSPSPPPYSKPSARRKSSDDDDDRRSSSQKKPSSQSKFEDDDDDDYTSSSKRNNSFRGSYNTGRARANS